MLAPLVNKWNGSILVVLFKQNLFFSWVNQEVRIFSHGKEQILLWEMEQIDQRSHQIDGLEAFKFLWGKFNIVLLISDELAFSFLYESLISIVLTANGYWV